MHLNVFAIVGRLVGNPKSFTCSRGAYTKFEIQYCRWEGERAQYFPCIAWDVNAKNTMSLLRSGMLVSLTGILEQNFWTNRNGDTKNEIVLKISSFEKLTEGNNYTSAPEPPSVPTSVDEILNGNTNNEPPPKETVEVPKVDMDTPSPFPSSVNEESVETKPKTEEVTFPIPDDGPDDDIPF